MCWKKRRALRQDRRREFKSGNKVDDESKEKYKSQKLSQRARLRPEDRFGWKRINGDANDSV